MGEDRIDLHIDLSEIATHQQYRGLWNKLDRIEIRMVEKNGECEHNLGDVFAYDTPYKKPKGVCNALLHVLDLYTWRVALGFPSWNAEDRTAYRIHCPDATGTVWEMKKVPKNDFSVK